MCSPEDKLILDSYVEGNFVTNDLIELIKNNSKLLDYEIYRGISIPKFMLNIGTDINKYYTNKVMSFSKSINVAKKFSEKLSNREFKITKSIRKEIESNNHLIADSFDFVNTIIRIKNIRSLDIYDDYSYCNKCYEKEKEVLLVTKPLYIQAITTEDDIAIIDCIDYN